MNPLVVKTHFNINIVLHTNKTVSLIHTSHIHSYKNYSDQRIKIIATFVFEAAVNYLPKYFGGVANQSGRSSIFACSICMEHNIPC